MTIPHDVLAERAAAYLEHGSQVKAAAALGIARETLQRSLRQASEAGLLPPAEPTMPGFAIKSVAHKTEDGAWVKQVREHGEEYAVPAAHMVKGESALVDAEGRVIQKWVKTREGDGPDIVEVLKTAFADYEGLAEPVPPPPEAKADLLTLIPCNDWHVNLLVWEREAGENWDLRIAEQVIGAGIEDAIARSPSSGVAVVLGGGDLLHADTNENRTAKSGNVLDADGRHEKGLEVAQRLKVRTIDAALSRNDHVIVRVLKGNHDEYSAAAIAHFLKAWYRNEPRITVDVDASLFWWHRFGKVMLGATHGHTVKLDQMPQIMAHRRAEDWGATRFRYVHGFHVHHKSKVATEGAGCVCESHQAPIPMDAWHYGSGYLSGRSLQTITYHRAYGEISRVRVAVLDTLEREEKAA